MTLDWSDVSGTASYQIQVDDSSGFTTPRGREAIWTGACSSSGSKRRTCTFTLNANGSVTANVQ